MLFWWQGRLDPELLLGLLVFGAIWGGDKGPEEPPSRREVDWLGLLLNLLSRRRPSPEEGLVRGTPLLDLPPVDFQPIPSPPPVPSLERRDREKLIKAMEEEFARRFRRVLQG